MHGVLRDTALQTRCSGKKSYRKEKRMAVVISQQKSGSRKIPAKVYPETAAVKAKSIRMLGFGIGNDRYGIDLEETMDVIRDLMMIQSSTPQSMTEQFVKRNRRNTIVFNLDRCLSDLGEGRAGRKPASFFMLEEKIQDCCVGILVPGIPVILTGKYPEDGTDSKSRSTMFPLVTIENSRRGAVRKSRCTVSLIDLRQFVENCIVRIRYADLQKHDQN
jgi:hypothetical protein